MPTNPYNPTGSQWSDNHLIQGRVSQDDFYWFKGKFPFGCTGIIDKVVSTLYKKLIDELRQTDREFPFDPAWSADHESYRILDDVLERLTVLERRPTGEYSLGGPTPPQHDSGRADSVRSEMQPVEVVGPVEEGFTPTGERSIQSPKEEKIKRRTRTRSTRKAKKTTRDH